MKHNLYLVAAIFSLEVPWLVIGLISQLKHLDLSDPSFILNSLKCEFKKKNYNSDDVEKLRLDNWVVMFLISSYVIIYLYTILKRGNKCEADKGHSLICVSYNSRT